MYLEERYRNEIRHPATVLIERTAEEVEQSIRAIERYRGSLKADVFVGEFPTGSINAQAVKVDGGFLVLINSGLLVVIQQVVEYLVAGDPDNPTDRDANRTTIDGVVAVLEAYLRFRRSVSGSEAEVRRAEVASCACPNASKPRVRRGARVRPRDCRPF